MAKYILLNGPAGVGKDTLGSLLQEQFTRNGMESRLDKFAAPLKTAVAAFMGLSDAEKRYYFETPEKEQPQRRFFNQTPRQALINFSELYAKVTFGNRVFAKLCIDRNADYKGIVIITDCGFTSEADEIFKEVGEAHVLLVHLTRNGLHFQGDSREYVANKPAKVVQTDGDVGDSLAELVTCVNKWMGV